MKIHILQENLLKALTSASRIIQQKTPLPILENILINANKEKVSITATSVDITEEIELKAKVEKEGAVCAPSKLLLDFISSLPPETVVLEDKGPSLAVVCKKYKALIPTVSVKEFPPSSKKEKQKTTKINKDTFTESIESVLFSAAHDESRPILMGVKITKTKEGLEFAATDGYRLSKKDISFDFPISKNVVLPARALREVLRLVSEKKDIEAVGYSESEDGQIAFVVEDTEINCRLLEGEFPAYEKIIPKTSSTSLVVNAVELRSAVRSVSIFARDNANIIRFQIEKGRMVVSASSSNTGESAVDIETETKGENATIAFNSRFLVDFLSVWKEEELMFEMTGSLNPGVFKSPKDTSYLHIIMPVRVGGQ